MHDTDIRSTITKFKTITSHSLRVLQYPVSFKILKFGCSYKRLFTRPARKDLGTPRRPCHCPAPHRRQQDLKNNHHKGVRTSYKFLLGAVADTVALHSLDPKEALVASINNNHYRYNKNTNKQDISTISQNMYNMQQRFAMSLAYMFISIHFFYQLISQLSFLITPHEESIALGLLSNRQMQEVGCSQTPPSTSSRVDCSWTFSFL